MDQEFKIRLTTMRRRLMESLPVEHVPELEIHPRLFDLVRAIARQMAEADFKADNRGKNLERESATDYAE